MPIRTEVPGHWNPPATRAELLDRATTAQVSLDGVAVRAAGVPLFKEVDGRLKQAIRVRAEGGTRDRPVTASLLSGTSVLDEIRLESGSAAPFGHLLVDDVESETELTLAVHVGSGSAQAPVIVRPERKWTVHLVHHSHFDYGYTDPQGTVLEHQLRYLDAALDLIQLTDDWPEESKFRWNVEVTYPLRKWLAARPKALRDELLRRAKEGRIEINALPFSMHSEVYGIDELAWGFNTAAELQDAEDIEIVSAIQSDVPGCTIGLLNLLTAAGIRYLSVAHNYAGRSMPHTHGGQDLTRPFWWQGEDGKRLLVWQSDTPHGVAYMDGVLVGMSDSEPVARELLPEYLAALAAHPYPYGKSAFGWFDIPAETEVTRTPYPYDLLCLRVQNGFADNAPPSLKVSETVRTWNDAWAYPKIRVSTNRDFFADAETRLGDQLDTFGGDWTDWWVDGVGSAALPLGLNREAQAAVRTAQTLHTITSALSGEQLPTADTEIDRVYEEAALFDEHTWGSANPWDDQLERFASGALQWGVKSSFAYSAFDRANVLLNSGLQHFGTYLGGRANDLASLVVFNPSSWSRTDVVNVFVPAERLVPGTTITLVHAESGDPVPVSIAPQPNPGFRAKGQWLTFIARDLPPVGFARYDLVAGETGIAPAPEVLDRSHAVETGNYAVQVDPANGFVASLRDTETGRDLVDSNAPFGFNEYIYDRYTSATKFNHLSGRIEDVDLRLFGSRTTATHAAVISRTSDAVQEAMTVRMQAEGCRWIESTVTLYHDLKRVEFRNRLQKIATLEKESVYFAFPFAVNDPDPEYEISGGVTSQGRPHVPGSARHMFAIRHWIGLHDGDGAAAWATKQAPLVELGTIALPFNPFPSTLPHGAQKPSYIYSWALNNIWDTNFPPQQGGEMNFDFAVGSSRSQDRRTVGIEIGAGFAQPLVGVCLRDRGGSPAPPADSYLGIDDARVQIVKLAPSRRGNGVVAFVHSLADEPVRATMRVQGLPVTRVEIGNHLERDLREVPLTNGAVALDLSSGAYVALVLTLE
jgi:hypothetical protein